MLSFSHEVFFEVAKNLSFSKAAEALYISQPAISKHIQSVEKGYKVSLFERKGNSVALTTEGKILLEHLVKARELQRQLAFDITRQKNLHQARGSLILGTSTTISLYVIPPVFSAFHRQIILRHQRLMATVSIGLRLENAVRLSTFRTCQVREEADLT